MFSFYSFVSLAIENFGEKLWFSKIMGLDYYAILDIPRSFNIHEIKSSYRKLALRLHPERKRFPKHPNPRPEGTFDLPLPSLPEDVYWEVLNEAYDVLSEPLHREVYNQYGEEGLKQGVSAPDGYIAPYRYHGDAMRTYFEFFSSYSPFSDLIDAITCPPPLYCVAEGVGVKNKDPTIEHLLQLELEEVFRGGVKFMKISRHEFVDEFEKKTEMKEVTLSVPITPGITEGTRLVFPEAGDRGPTRIPADVAFTVCDQPHEFFRRDKSNLHMDHEITLKESLTGFKMKISTIDDRKLEFLITDVVE